MKKYPSPRKSVTFTRYWNLFIDDISARPNFILGHLEQLKVLCEMYEESEELKELIKTNGYTYSVSGRNGDQEKVRPEVQQLNKVRADIRAYSILLGLNLMKSDKLPKDDAAEEEWG
jgi:hypothetical protein